MKETKITKRIFAVFVAFIVILLISCGDLQVFADGNVTITFRLLGSSSYTRILSIYNVDNYPSNTRVVYQTFNTGANAYFDYSVTLPAGHTYSLQYYSETSAYRFMYLKFDFNGAELSRVRTSPTVIEDSSYILGNNYNETTQFFYYIVVPSVATPTPEPTPTPTPTPDPTPTPAPTFNPDQPTYTTFFNHLLNDGNNALNALYLSWTSANNKFYTGIFFIGLPIMIGIFGIVASIFFGGDD